MNRKEGEMAGLQAETVRRWARESQDIEIPEAESAAIAAGIEPLAAVLRAAPRLLFDSEPADFVKAQHRWLGGAR
jgi:hypothetical protein